MGTGWACVAENGQITPPGQGNVRRPEQIWAASRLSPKTTQAGKYTCKCKYGQWAEAGLRMMTLPSSLLTVYPKLRKMGSPDRREKAAAPEFTPRPVGLWGSIVPSLIKEHLWQWKKLALIWQTTGVESTGTHQNQELRMDGGFSSQCFGGQLGSNSHRAGSSRSAPSYQPQIAWCDKLISF